MCLQINFSSAGWPRGGSSPGTPPGAATAYLNSKFNFVSVDGIHFSLLSYQVSYGGLGGVGGGGWGGGG